MAGKVSRELFARRAAIAWVQCDFEQNPSLGGHCLNQPMLLRFRSAAASATATPSTAEASQPVAKPSVRPDRVDDGDLVRRAASGDAAALGQLYERHGAAVYRFAWVLTGSEAAAADVVQEAFLAMFGRGGSFDPARGSCAAYLCGIARHLAARQVDPRIELSPDIDDLAQAESAHCAHLTPPPSAAAERAQSLDRLYRAIRRLPPHYRDVLVLVELQELSYAEVAAIAGIELGTVRSRLARARERLRELLGADDAIANRDIE